MSVLEIFSVFWASAIIWIVIETCYHRLTKNGKNGFNEQYRKQ